jgi:hypothetical protein
MHPYLQGSTGVTQITDIISTMADLALLLVPT